MEKKTVHDFMNPELYEEKKEKFKQQIIESLNKIDDIVEDDETNETEIESSLLNLFYENEFEIEYEENRLNLINNDFIYMQFEQQTKQFTFSKEQYNSAFTDMTIYAEQSPEYHIQHFIKKYFHLNRWNVSIKTIL